MSREAMKLALEALIGARAFLESDAPVEIWGLNDKAITALREALAEQPAQQEPVVWMYVNRSTHETIFQRHMRSFVDHGNWTETPLYSEPLANHELICVCGAVWCGDEMVHLPHKSTSPQRKPLTDDPLQGAVDWLLEADGEYFCTATVQRTLRIGYNRAKRLCDTAKERAAHGIKENT